MKMCTRKCKTIVALALTVGAACAQAATVSYSGSTGVVSTTGSLSLQQFDPSLGTLTGIAIDWDSGFSARFVVTQETPSDSGTVVGADSFVSSSIVNISAPAGTSAPTLNATAGTAFSASIPPTYQQIVSGGAADSQSYGPLASFVGVGTVGYGFFGSATDTSTASNGLVRGLQDYLYLINADITYTYTVGEVPLPAAAWLFGSALLGLGVMKRRKA